MEIKNNRQLAILYYFISISKHATSESLSNFVHSSIRTIKSDISILNKMLSNEGICAIEVNKSEGYTFIILDIDEFSSFKDVIKSKYSFYRRRNIEKMTRRIYILQRILSSEEGVKLENLAEELYLSKSAIREDMAWVVSFCESYDVELISKPYEGYRYEGTEYNIRFLMVEAFCNQYHYVEDSLIVQEFNDMFYSDEVEYQCIRHNLLKILRESCYSIKDINSKKVATYLTLSINRNKKGYFVVLSSEVKEEIKSYYEFELAQKIIKMLNFSNYEDELYTLAMILIIFRDIDLTVPKDIKTANREIIYKSSLMYDEVFLNYEGIGKTLINTEFFPRFRTDFISSFYSLFLVDRYDSCYKKQLSTYYEVSSFEFSPLSIEMTRNVIRMCKNIVLYKFNKVSAYRYILLFELILKKVNYSYIKRKLAIISTGGRVIAKNYKVLLGEKFSKFCEYMHVFNQYEMRGVNFTDYDVIIGDGDSMFNNYSIPIINSNILKVEDSTVQIFNDVFKKGYSRKQIEKLIKITSIYDDFECSDYHMLFKVLSYKYSIKNSKSLEVFLNEGEAVWSYLNSETGVAIILIDYRYSDREFLEIMYSSNKMMWTPNQEVKYIIIGSINSSLEISELKVINKILQILYNDEKQVENVIADKKKAYDSIFDLIITNHFMRK